MLVQRTSNHTIKTGTYCVWPKDEFAVVLHPSHQDCVLSIHLMQGSSYVDVLYWDHEKQRILHAYGDPSSTVDATFDVRRLAEEYKIHQKNQDTKGLYLTTSQRVAFDLAGGDQDKQTIIWQLLETKDFKNEFRKSAAARIKAWCVEGTDQNSGSLFSSHEWDMLGLKSLRNSRQKARSFSS